MLCLDDEEDEQRKASISFLSASNLKPKLKRVEEGYCRCDGGVGLVLQFSGFHELMSFWINELRRR
jgi:hypothetical protein